MSIVSTATSNAMGVPTAAMPVVKTLPSSQDTDAAATNWQPPVMIKPSSVLFVLSKNPDAETTIVSKTMLSGPRLTTCM